MDNYMKITFVDRPKHELKMNKQDLGLILRSLKMGINGNVNMKVD